jgi:fatty-acyl-CoA synthase
MTGRIIAAAKSAYQYPLIVKHLWHAPLLQAADQEIVYRDLKRFTYRELRRRSVAWHPHLRESGSDPAI